VLTPDATIVLVGAPMSAKGLGPLKHIAGTRAAATGRSQTVTMFQAKIERADLTFMADLLEAGKIRSVIDRRYELRRASEALAYLGETHARGKIVLTI
jgi:NADPH:quinone reductase-like Zn-dependent oxidoreductase